MQEEIAELRDALDHISRVCLASRTQTHRIRWIKHRADCAMNGEDWKSEDIGARPSTKTIDQYKSEISQLINYIRLLELSEDQLINQLWPELPDYMRNRIQD